MVAAPVAVYRLARRRVAASRSLYTVAVHYELWDLQTANLMGEYDSEAEALADVREALAAGWDADRLGLGREFDDHDIGDDELLSIRW